MRQDGPIRVLHLESDVSFRTRLAAEMARHSDLRMLSGSSTPAEAREVILRHHPDVIFLNLDLPQVDGLTLLRKLRVNYPVPVVLVGGGTNADAARAIRALEFGALDVRIRTNEQQPPAALARLADDLADLTRIAFSQARPIVRSAGARVTPPQLFRTAGIEPSNWLVAIGASIGGTEAIRTMLGGVPADFPPVAIVQHLPAGFTRAFAERLANLTGLRVSEAADGDVLDPGMAVVGPIGSDMRIERLGGVWRVRVLAQATPGEPQPRIDGLFESVARVAGNSGVGILLTGEGPDGARGLLTLHDAGGVTLAQSAASCAVYGAPKLAVSLGAATHLGRPDELPLVILRSLTGRRRLNPIVATQR